ncbi:MAG: MlaE family lipid ABC transporter permease subunit [Pseudomonadota bacterium]
MTSAATYTLGTNDGANALALAGDWTLAQLGDAATRLENDAPKPAEIDLSGVERIDTIGAWIVHRLARDSDAKIVGANEDTQHLIEQVARGDAAMKVRPDRISPFTRVLGEIGDATAIAGKTLLGLLGFFGSVCITTWHLMRNPRSFRINAVIQRFEIVGVKALGIIGLMSFLIGLVIAQQGSVQLAQFGFEAFTINLVGRITFRELGLLMTAIMVAGRSGSAFAAQLGTMKLTEEIDAMRTIGISPNEALVLPRIIASVAMMPLLGVYASIIAVIGGGLFCWISLEIPPLTYIQRIREVVPMTDVYIGLIKAPVFGLIIALCGCFQGLQVEGDAEQVGLRTTSAVVQAIFLVIVLDAVFAVFFTGIGWK